MLLREWEGTEYISGRLIQSAERGSSPKSAPIGVGGCLAIQAAHRMISITALCICAVISEIGCKRLNWVKRQQHSNVQQMSYHRSIYGHLGQKILGEQTYTRYCREMYDDYENDNYNNNDNDNDYRSS